MHYIKCGVNSSFLK